MFASIQACGTLRGEVRLLHKDGGIVPAELNAIMLPNGELYGALRDIRERKAAEQALRASEERFRRLFEDSPDPAWVMQERRFIEGNPAAAALFGYPDGAGFLNAHPADISPPSQPDGESSQTKAERMMMTAERQGVLRFEWRHRRMDGSEFDAEVTLSAIELAGRPALYAVVRDITARKAMEWRLEHEAHTDALTGCATRRHFLQIAHQELTRVRRYGGELSLLMIDIDHFKCVNDNYGHQVGDLALQTLVQVCRPVLRQGDLLGRLGGEEFAILLIETGNERAFKVAERLREAVAAAEVPSGKWKCFPLHFTTSIGVATVDEADAEIDSLIKRADEALYAAKNAGRNRVE